MEVEYVDFHARRDRSRFIARRFAAVLSGSVLDVGCDEAHLRGMIGASRYVGIDVSGRPDRLVDLEKAERLPFADGEFETVVCSDVLEHLDSLHRLFGELVRVAAKHLVLSLPNNWTNARRPIERGHGAIAHYGLPARPPKDRHKWFFGLSEALAFFEAQQAGHPVRLVHCEASEKPRPALVRLIRRIRYPAQIRYLNRYAHTLWAQYEKIA
jgi:SAM-dependent methyltransferase